MIFEMIFEIGISIILTFILRLIIIYCKITYHAPNSEIVKKNIWKWKDGKCYKFNIKPVICPI